jgi:dihydrodipicolinate synthase/N-acetylneuraminate lyase
VTIKESPVTSSAAPDGPGGASARFAGVHVALTTPFAAPEGEVDHDALEAHCDWLVGEGIDGLIPNGSLGEYEAMDQAERQSVVETVAAVTRGRAKLIVGVSGVNWRIAGEHTRHAIDVGADGVMLLPPTNHSPTPTELRDHYRSVAAYGLPVVVYNNPFSTHIDLTPDSIVDLAEIDGIAAVKESSRDVRRISELIERVPHLEALCGPDDLALESALMGAVGWIGGFTGAFPAEAIAVFRRGQAGDVAAALPQYRALLPLFRWDSDPRFVEAVKHTIDLLGRRGGGVPRPPRRVLSEDDRRLLAAQFAHARAALAG